MTDTVASLDVARQTRRFQSLQLRLATLQGQARELQTRQTVLARDISLAKARLELGPEATETFNYLQEKAHAEAVGDFEDLLSAFVSDVIPDAGSIRLELGTERGAPALDIMVDNGGDIEDILTGNGGALTNVVVTGLGFSALSRTSNRQLMVLDEPDCWLKSVNVPAFTKVIAEVANPRRDEDGTVQPGCQTLMISHNDIALMDEGAHIQDLRIERDLAAFAARHGVEVVTVGKPAVNADGEPIECAYVVWVDGKAGKKPTIEVRYRPAGEGDEEQNALTKGFPYLESIGGARAWESEEQEGIRWIEATNLRTHIHTRMELSSGLNVLTGPVNAGKSNLYFTAQRAMGYGESDDRMIRHGADSCTIRMGLEGGVVLEMVRVTKGTPKVVFSRYDSAAAFKAGKPSHKAAQERKNSVPSFIADALKIARVDGLDIQLRSQKEPIFMLNETPAVRAQLLSVGRESGLLQELIERHRQQSRRDKDAIKHDEIELALVNRTLTVLAPVASMTALTEILSAMLDDARVESDKLAMLRELVGRMTPLQSLVQLQDAVGEKLGQAITVPTCVETSTLVSLITRIAQSQAIAQFEGLQALPVAPTLQDTAALSKLLVRIQDGQQAARLAQLVPTVPQVATVADVAGVRELIQRLSKGAHAELVANALQAAPMAPALHDTASLRREGVVLSQRAAEVTQLTADEKVAVTEEKQADDALHALKDELGVCPVCNKAFKE